MNTRKGHLEDIPELNEGLRCRSSVIPREINCNGVTQNLKEMNEAHKEPDISENNSKLKPTTDVIQNVVVNEDYSRIVKDGWFLCDFHNLPSWMQDNDCIHSGYRPPLPSFTACFQSIFRIHTETVNIWSHLLGCIVFIALAIISLVRLPNIQERLAITPFFAGAILCLGFSFTFHTLHCHSPEVLRFFSHLDYCGIALLITGSFVPWLYFGFYCYFWLKMVYLILISTLGTCAVFVSLLENFGQASYRPLRATVFCIFGLSGFVPGVHYLMIVGWDQTIGIPLLIIAFTYILGAALYACRFPERLLPGRCDIWFHSHQVFHILVVIATLINYYSLTDVYNRLVTMKCQ